MLIPAPDPFPLAVSSDSSQRASLSVSSTTVSELGGLHSRVHPVHREPAICPCPFQSVQGLSCIGRPHHKVGESFS